MRLTSLGEFPGAILITNDELLHKQNHPVALSCLDWSRLLSDQTYSDNRSPWLYGQTFFDRRSNLWHNSV